MKHYARFCGPMNRPSMFFLKELLTKWGSKWTKRASHGMISFFSDPYQYIFILHGVYISYRELFHVHNTSFFFSSSRLKLSTVESHSLFWHLNSVSLWRIRSLFFLSSVGNWNGDGENSWVNQLLQNNIPMSCVKNWKQIEVL